MKKEKSGAVTTIEKNTLRDRALQTLRSVKNNPKEQIKRPVRLSNRTVVLVSPERYKYYSGKERRWNYEFINTVNHSAFYGTSNSHWP